MSFNIFQKAKIRKVPEGFKLMTKIFVVNALTHCAMLLSYILGKIIFIQ